MTRQRWTRSLGRLGAGVGLVVGLATASCAEPETGSSSSDITELKDFYRDGRDLDLSDLLSVTSGFATEELNDALAFSEYASLSLEPTELYTTSDQVDQSWLMHDLDELVTGLAHRFGERDLTTQVNAVRQQRLHNAGGVYAESAFDVRAGLHDWGHDVGGWEDGWLRVGFDANAELEARVVSVHDGWGDALVQSPLESVRASRGFVLPRGVGDLRALSPGESYALRGTGRLGANVGAGVPFLVTSVDAISYNLVLSAGLRTLLEGIVDLQVVRLEGDTLVIDVGIERAKTKQARVALEDAWGVQGLLESHVDIGPWDVDLGRLVEKALQRQLNKRLDLIEATWEKTNIDTRLSVARFRFDLSQATPGSPQETAIAQLLHADLRLAQALANRGEAGVVAEFDLSRSGVSRTSYAGLDLFGMRFFREQQEQEGSVVVQTPGGALALYFESLHKESGWFFSSHGYTRVALGGLRADAEGFGESEANLFLQIVEGDKAMERDKLLDHVDGVILGVAGPEAMVALETQGNALERYVEAACPNSQAFDPCRDAVLDDPEVIALRQAGRAALAEAIAPLEPELQALLLELGDLRLAAQAAYEPKAQFVGPSTSIVVDYRLGDGALAELMDANDEAMRTALLRYLQVAGVDRDDSPAEIAEDRNDIASDNAALANTFVATFAEHRARYREVVGAEGFVLPQHPELGPMGQRAVEIRFPVSADDAVIYEQAVAQSLGRARASVAARMVDDLIDVMDDTKGLGHPERAVAYTLLGTTSAAQTDLRTDFRFKSFGNSYDHYVTSGYRDIDHYARGSEAALIGGGMFDLDALLELE